MAQLVGEPGARLCAYAARQWSSNAGETQEQMKQRLVRAGFEGKSTIAVVAGHYPLPTISESRAFLLPMCVEDRGVAVVEGVNARRSNNTLYVSCAMRHNTCTDVMVPGVATLRVDEYRWAASPGLGLAVPLRLRATIDGATIDLRSYESMTGVYGHHAFERSYFFASPTPSAARAACASTSVSTRARPSNGPRATRRRWAR
jgi:hypothetical protein